MHRNACHAVKRDDQRKTKARKDCDMPPMGKTREVDLYCDSYTIFTDEDE